MSSCTGRHTSSSCTVALSDAQRGDAVHFADWRGDPDQFLVDGVEFASLLADLAERGVAVRGLVWRSHPKATGFHLEHHVELADKVNDAGGLILLDQRVRPAGSHHQKLVVIRYAGEREDVAFLGGIDLCHGRRDDARHGGDPQPEELDGAYGERPPWHDVQVAVPRPGLGGSRSRLPRTMGRPDTDGRPANAVAGDDLQARQTAGRGVTRSTAPAGPVGCRRDRGPGAADLPAKRPPYPFAPEGERSIVRAYERAFARARSLIYVEDQYMWSKEIASLFAAALRRAPDLRVIVVVPRFPDRNGVVSGPPHGSRSWSSSTVARRGGGRFAIYDLENDAGTPIYVHAKTVVVDDVWAAVGSDNLNRRSWTHDSELSIGGAGLPARRPRAGRPGGSRRRSSGLRPRPPSPAHARTHGGRIR